MKILVAVDASDRTQHVLESAVQLAERLGSVLFVLRRVTVPPEFPAAAAGSVSDLLATHLAVEAARVLMTLIGTVARTVLLVAHVGRVQSRRYAWAECRAENGPLARREVERFHRKVRTDCTSVKADRKPRTLIIVAGVIGFAPDAVELARSLGIECYRRAPRGFERVD